MEGRLQISESSPLLDDDYDYDYDHGIVKHPFPLNCFMRNWYLGSDFYHAVKIGIVQYVCMHDQQPFSSWLIIIFICSDWSCGFLILDDP